MSQLIPMLIGISGLAAGEVFAMTDQADMVIGRSRACDISFQRFRRFQALSPAEQQERESNNNAVSRRHLRIRIQGGKVILENLSSNGSYCNDQRFDAIHEIDLWREGVQLRLGNAPEVFQLQLMAGEKAAGLLTRQKNTTSIRTKPVAPLAPVPEDSSSPSGATKALPVLPAVPPAPADVPKTDARPDASSNGENSVYL